MTNSRESTSIIISIPPGKTLLVVISRSLWECHMNAKPRSLGGLVCVLEGCWEEQVSVAVEFVAQLAATARRVASGPRYGLPPYQAPFEKMLGLGRVAGPPPATSPRGATSRGLLWSWHHS